MGSEQKSKLKKDFRGLLENNAKNSHFLRYSAFQSWGGVLMRGKVFILTLLVVLGLIFGGGYFLSEPVPEPPVYEEELAIDHERAYENIRYLCENFPNRDIFSEDNRLAVAWLKERLNALGLETGTMEFDAWAGEEKVEGLENVYGISRGTAHPEEIIIVTSHVDIPEFVYQGAADAGSDVGIILELARVFSEEEHARTLLFLFTNNEEYGMWGAYHFAREYEDIDKVVAVLGMDYMNMGEYGYTRVRFEGMQKGYTPLWLRELAVSSAEKEGTVRHVDPLMEWVERAVTIASQDVGMFLSAGVPAVNICSRAVDEEWQMEIYHTEEDTMEHIRLDTVEIYGNTAERILRSLDNAPEVQAGEMNYFKYNDRYLPGWVINTIQIMLFFPFFLLLGMEIRRGYTANLSRALRRDGSRFLFILLSGLAGYFLLRFLPTTDLMVRYELYPATQKDPVLYEPQYIPVILVLVVILVVGFLLFRLVRPGFMRRDEGEFSGEMMESGRWLLLFILAIVIIITWLEGSGFAAAIFFLLPAYLWPWIKPARSVPRRILNVILLLTGCAVFFAFVYIFATTYQVGVMWWYILLGAAFGLLSWKAVFVFLWGVSLLLAMLPLAWGRPR